MVLDAKEQSAIGGLGNLEGWTNLRYSVNESVN